MPETSQISWQTQYEDGIEQARAMGAVRTFGQPKEDFFSHLEKGLDGSNTRPLRTVTQAIAQSMRQTARHNVIRCLELGPGCGRAAGQLRVLLGDAIRLETVGRTPFNPYLRLQMDVIGIGKAAERLLEQDSGEAEGRSVLEPVRGAVLGLTLGTIMKLHSMGLVKAFQEYDKPFVDLQHIGEFGELDDIGTYALVYEDNGPFRHTKDMEPDFSRALGLTADNGVLVLSPFTDPTCSPRTQAILSKLEPHLQEGDVLRVVPNSYKPSHSDLVIARKHSHLRPQLMEEHWREHMSDLLRSAIGYTY